MSFGFLFWARGLSIIMITVTFKNKKTYKYHENVCVSFPYALL